MRAISSGSVLRAIATSGIKLAFGVRLPVSHPETVPLETPILRPKHLWLSPIAIRLTRTSAENFVAAWSEVVSKTLVICKHYHACYHACQHKNATVRVNSLAR